MVKLLEIASLIALSSFSTIATYSPIAARIIGGTEAVEGQFPSMLALIRDEERVCGAVLVGPMLAMTTAHCVATPEMQAGNSVRAGSLYWGGGGTEVQVISVIIHPKYDRKRWRNDIALLRLSAQIPQSQNTKYTKLPEQGYDPPGGSDGIAAGWGHINKDYSSNFLLYTHMPLGSRAECKKKFPRAFTDNMICGGEEGHTTALGDSGGPLYMGEGETQTCVGLISFGSRKRPETIFVRVGIFVDWIRSHL